MLDSGGTSSYNGLILAMQKRLSKGLQHQRQLHLVALHRRPDHRQQHRQRGRRYHSVDFPNNRRYDRSNCQSVEIGGTFSSDRRQIFNWTTVYETPKFSNHTVNLLGSGWRILGNLPGACRRRGSRSALGTDVSFTGVGAPAANLRPNATGVNRRCAPIRVRLAGSTRPLLRLPRRARSATWAATTYRLRRISRWMPRWSAIFKVHEGYTLRNSRRGLQPDQQPPFRHRASQSTGRCFGPEPDAGYGRCAGHDWRVRNADRFARSAHHADGSEVRVLSEA